MAFTSRERNKEEDGQQFPGNSKLIKLYNTTTTTTTIKQIECQRLLST